jgi:hypothetical protein
MDANQRLSWRRLASIGQLDAVGGEARPLFAKAYSHAVILRVFRVRRAAGQPSDGHRSTKHGEYRSLSS